MKASVQREIFTRHELPPIESSSAGFKSIRGAVVIPGGVTSLFGGAMKSSGAAFGFASGAIRLMRGLFGLAGGGIRLVSGAIRSTSGAVGLTGGAIRLADSSFITIELPAFCVEFAFGSGNLPV
jgi:hypothetical protein